MAKSIWLLVIIIALGVIVGSRVKQQAKLETATFAGGCFWCMQPPFEKLNGVKAAISGYTGGIGTHPTYETYANQKHIEAIQITYDPTKIAYKELLDVFWHQIDPTDAQGQFVDKGPHYRSAIFYHNEEQKKLAEASKENLQKSGLFNKPIVTEIIPASAFYPAETYHQDFYKTDPVKYKSYRSGSGRDTFLEKTWGKNDTKKVSDVELRTCLTPLQYTVTQENGTEKAYSNEYWNNKEPGIYVDLVSGEPLFSSLDKYDSGTGWPSFIKPLAPENIIEKEDKELLTPRTEVRSKHGNAHLGHVFKDGPAPTGLRYCMNSAALRFIPVNDLEKEGYGEYKKLFE